MHLVAPNDEPRLEGPKVASLPIKPLTPDAGACLVRGVDDGGDASRQVAESLDRSLHYFISRFTFGISPIGLSEAYFDWLIHLCGSPGKQVELWHEAVGNSVKLLHYLSECACHERLGIAPCIAPRPNDKRFSSEDWQVFPFNFMHQAFLLNQHWWHTATTGVRGVSEHHARVMEFLMRQVLDVVSPSNYLLTNPEVLKKTHVEAGKNLVRGMRNLVEDTEHSISGKKPAGLDAFTLGTDLAATPGKIVYRNRLIELIQYEPTTRQVRPEPILFIPAWIMKYYILDLSPTNSLVRYMRDQGFTVFMVSWKNPGAEDRDLGFEDYLKLGAMSAIDVIEK